MPRAPKTFRRLIPALENGLNRGSTFDSFVIGSCNQFAYEAARVIAESPGKVYNPLFLYGPTGLGKTHLMLAIAWHAASAPKASVLYRSGERFTDEFIQAIRNGALTQFRKCYRKADLLLCDNVQSLSGRETKEEFLHVFDARYDGHKQIILAGLDAPGEILNLDRRLAARFALGLTAELRPPDFDTRLAILRMKADSLIINIEPRIIEFIAERISLNVRRLEGALVRVASYCSLSGGKVNTETVKCLLRDILDQEAKEGA
jgi:chromosomal replication initiator protein